MLAWWVGLGLLWLWQSTRKRLDRAEQRARELAEALSALAAEQNRLIARLGQAERRLSEWTAPQPPAAAISRRPDAAAPVSPPLEASPSPLAEPASPGIAPAAAPPVLEPERVAPVALPASAGRPVSPQPAPGPDPFEAAASFLRELLFGGNTLVRVGILILLVGVVLLLRWAAEHSLFPIELRLLSTAVAALALTGIGVRQRRARPGFALTLEGGGVAALYLVVCFAFRSYALLPAWLAFALLCALSVACAALSVLQDSLSLIVIAQLGAFAAPLFASSGAGSHVALFTYYLILNLLVFAVALFKAWRPLNLLGFVFTFGVATAWGALRYEPDLFASTEPFLIAFFALYLAIPLLFALRHAGTPRGWVDGGIVFGTPLSALALQWSLVHGRPFAMAWSALALAAVYIGLASAIKRSGRERLADLGEAYLPIGVGFATLAIPYALDDNHLTGASWALEGAGLYWVGVRQSRLLSRAAGVALQVAAGIAASVHPARAAASLPVVNSWFVAGALIGTSALFVASYAYAHRAQLRQLEWQGLQAAIAWGLLFWLRAGLGELDAWAPASLMPGAQLCWLGLFACALELSARKLAWWPGRVPALGLWPVMLGYLCYYAFELDAQPLRHGGFLGWPAVALAMLLVLRHFVAGSPQLTAAHAGAVWLWALWGVLFCEQICTDSAGLDASYAAALANLSLAGWVLAILRQSRGSGWPAGVLREHYLEVAGAGLLVLGAVRAAAANLTLPVHPAPLPYLPLLNPLDLSSLIGAVVAFLWLRRLRFAEPALCSAAVAQRTAAAICACLFAWWNTQLARSVHHYARVDFEPEALFDSSALQLALSLSWTLIALGMMWAAHRRALRLVWMVAAGLLVVVVAKLFLLDLSQLSTPAKIASFLGVGALLLLIGYIAPVPPRSSREPKAAALGMSHES